MRRIFQLSVLSLAAGVVVACAPEKVIQTEDIPTAGVRFLNVVPDTGGAFGVDFRPVDIVENSTFYQMTFRNTTLFFYKNARAGSRHFKVFLDDSLASVASTVLADTTITLEAGKRYTFILWGFSRTGQTPAMKLDVITDDPADPGTQIALRTINACLPGICGAAANGVVDVRQYPAAGPVPGAATWAAVPVQSFSSYVQAAPGSIKFNVTPTGNATALFTDPTALPGAAGTVDIEALPGTTVAGSAVTGIVVPRSVAGSKAANVVTPGMIFVWDRRPPRLPTQ